MAVVMWFFRSLARKAGNNLRRLRKGPEWIHMVIDGSYPDFSRPRGNFWQRRLFRPETSLQDLKRWFDIIGADPRPRGVVLHLRHLAMPFSRLQAMRDLLIGLQKQGKRVVVWSSGYDTAGYYVATAANEILLQRGGRIAPLGLQEDHVFMAQALERMGLELDVVRISPFKSAADRLTRTSMSDEVREMNNWLLDANYAQLTEAIARGRNIDMEKARALVDASPYTDRQSIDAGAVDKLISEEDLPGHLGPIVSWSVASRSLLRPPLTRPGSYIALLRIQGAIVDGESQRPPMRPPLPVPFLFGDRAGDVTVVQMVRKVVQDKKARGLLVYIDSGGGSASASEAMSAALTRLAEHKPVVAMMGAAAASGGYYVAAPAHWIVAQPGTLTGSIGVLTAKLVNSRFLDKLSIHRETLFRGENAAMDTGDKRFTHEERRRVQDFIDSTYDLFLERVAKGRKMDRAAVDAVGGGRVWTGSQALEHGLVDQLGGMEAAMDKLRELSGAGPGIPLRDVGLDRHHFPPLADPASALGYALNGLRMLNRFNTLCTSPVYWYDPYM